MADVSSERGRVVVTGIGVVAPGGVGVDAFWSMLTAGRTATRRISFFDPSAFRSQVAAEIDFNPVAHGLTPHQTRRIDRAGQLAIAAVREAFASSGLDRDAMASHRVGVSVGTAVGATMSLDEEYRIVSDGGRLHEVDERYAAPFLYQQMVPSSFAVEVAREVRAEGPVHVVSTGCTSGIDAVGFGAQLVAEGSADVVVAGAADAPISPITMACFDAIKATTPRLDSPETASRPFDATRSGFVLGEGAAFFVLESEEHARSRGALVLAEVNGYATRCNAHHMTGLRLDGAEMSEAIDRAMSQGKVSAGRIDYINAHGSGTKQNDRHETAAFKRSLGGRAYEVPISSIKSMVGHSLGAIGAIEIAASILAIRDDVAPPTANLHEADPECDLDYVPITARETPIDTVLTVGSGFGGFQSAMILSGASS
jgi:act minimal PKS ketosynthase (KS/KS alpha)